MSEELRKKGIEKVVDNERGATVTGTPEGIRTVSSFVNAIAGKDMHHYLRSLGEADPSIMDQEGLAVDYRAWIPKRVDVLVKMYASMNNDGTMEMMYLDATSNCEHNEDRIGAVRDLVNRALEYMK